MRCLLDAMLPRSRPLWVLVWIVLASPALADHAPAHRPNPIGSAFGDSSALAEHDPFPAEALSGARRPGCPILLDHRMNDLRGRPIDLCAFGGKVLLVVNTASRCGYTPQYEGLQALHVRLRAKGFLVLGFPSNDFGGQEPGNSKEIAEFCSANFGVTFPMFEKVRVKGANKSPFYRGLTAGAAPAADAGEISWNFEKFLIGRDGRLLGRYRSSVTPEAPELLAHLNRALGQ